MVSMPLYLESNSGVMHISGLYPKSCFSLALMLYNEVVYEIPLCLYYYSQSFLIVNYNECAFTFGIICGHEARILEHLLGTYT